MISTLKESQSHPPHLLYRIAEENSLYIVIYDQTLSSIIYIKRYFDSTMVLIIMGTICQSLVIKVYQYMKQIAFSLKLFIIMVPQIRCPYVSFYV